MDSVSILEFISNNGNYIIAALIGALVGTIIRAVMRNHQINLIKAVALETMLIDRRGHLAGLMSKQDIFVSRDRLSITDEAWLNFEYFHLWPMVMAYVLDEVVGDIYTADYLDRRTAYDDLVIVLENNGGKQLDFAHQMEQYSDRAARGMRIACLRRDREKANAHWDMTIAVELSMGAVSEMAHVVEVDKPAELPVPNS